MLVLFTWSEYGVIILAALVVYYTVFVIVYFKNEVLSLSFIKERYKNKLSSDGNELYQADKDVNSLFQNRIGDTSLVQKTDETFQQVEQLTVELKGAIKQAVENNQGKEHFFLSLQLILKQYHFLKGSPFLVAINNLIASECDKHGFIRLTADERVMLWN